MVTEYLLKTLSDKVYQLDSKHKDYSPMEVGDIKVFGGIEFQILKVEDNTENGMQAMAVAPIKNNKVDMSDIIIAFAGTNIKDFNDLRTDLETVVLGNKDFLVKKERIGYSTAFVPIPVDSQIGTAKKFADDIQLNYPNASITTTGHSLGQYIGLYIAAEYRWKNVGFNGPDPYNILSPEAKDWIKDNPGMLFNYRNKEDKFGNHGGNGTGAGILIDMNMDGLMVTFKAHGLNAWEFDSGSVKISDSYANKEARLIREEKMMYARMNELSLLANKLKISRGLSTSDEIYLDNMQALITVKHASKSMKIGLEYVIKIYQDAIVEAEDLWENGIQRAQAIGTELSYHEILDALAAGGATKYSIVLQPTAYYRNKISEALKLGADFEHLASEIRESIKELEQVDKDLANKIKQGA